MEDLKNQRATCLEVPKRLEMEGKRNTEQNHNENEKQKKKQNSRTKQKELTIPSLFSKPRYFEPPKLALFNKQRAL